LALAGAARTSTPTTLIFLLDHSLSSALKAAGRDYVNTAIARQRAEPLDRGGDRTTNGSGDSPLTGQSLGRAADRESPNCRV
jgi:hypothetical protein